MRALIIAAPMFSNMGTQLWHSDSVNRKKKKLKKSLREKVDYGIYMKQWRFKQLKLLLPKTMQDDTKKETDAWWRTRKLMENYTKNMTEIMYASSTTVLDESMSAFIPRTTKSGNLPNLSFVKRKPEPLGTEFKVAMDGLTGKSLSLETQEGNYICVVVDTYDSTNIIIFVIVFVFNILKRCRKNEKKVVSMFWCNSSMHTKGS